MDIKFKQWAEDIAKALIKNGIETDNIVNAGHEGNNPSTRVDHMTVDYLGRITVWNSWDMTVEILDVETFDTIMFENFELREDENFDIYLKEYFKVLNHGNKK